MKWPNSWEPFYINCDLRKSYRKHHSWANSDPLVADKVPTTALHVRSQAKLVGDSTPASNPTWDVGKLPTVLHSQLFGLSQQMENKNSKNMWLGWRDAMLSIKSSNIECRKIALIYLQHLDCQTHKRVGDLALIWPGHPKKIGCNDPFQLGIQCMKIVPLLHSINAWSWYISY